MRTFPLNPSNWFLGDQFINSRYSSTRFTTSNKVMNDDIESLEEKQVWRISEKKAIRSKKVKKRKRNVTKHTAILTLKSIKMNSIKSSRSCQIRWSSNRKHPFEFYIGKNEDFHHLYPSLSFFFRRTVMTRHRSITELSATLVDPYHFRLRLTTQAGAYVKEFVHGDFGRTKPNLTMILNRFVDILELDVLVRHSELFIFEWRNVFFSF